MSLHTTRQNSLGKDTLLYWTTLLGPTVSCLEEFHSMHCNQWETMDTVHRRSKLVCAQLNSAIATKLIKINSYAHDI